MMRDRMVVIGMMDRIVWIVRIIWIIWIISKLCW